MRRSAAIAAAALFLAGCGGATSNGFTAAAPGGWEDETDAAETKTGTDFEVVYEGPSVEGVAPLLTVHRLELPEDDSLRRWANDARNAIDRRGDTPAPTVIEEDRLAGDVALRFDYSTGEKRARYITAKHGNHFYAVTVESAPGGFDRALVVLTDYLASWRWES